MTTTVNIEANCSDDLRVEVSTQNTTGAEEPRTVVLCSGQTLTEHVYDDKSITVRERPQQAGDPDPEAP